MSDYNEAIKALELFIWDNCTSEEESMIMRDYIKTLKAENEKLKSAISKIGGADMMAFILEEDNNE